MRSVLCLLFLFTASAHAHFQLLLPAGELALSRPGSHGIFMPFTHPATSGHVMGMSRPEAFYVVHRGVQKDLSGTLEPIDFQSAENTGKAWISAQSFKRLGDHVLVLEPAPYFEADEDTYIQQITKTVVNVGGLPTDWDAPLGLKAEIVPLVHPSAVWAGGVFSAQILANGQPVPGAGVEVERLNYPIDPTTSGFSDAPTLRPPVALLEVQSVRADSNGVITLGLPFAGRWGIAALDLVPGSQFDGKALSVDAVLWVDARSPRADR